MCKWRIQYIFRYILKLQEEEINFSDGTSAGDSNKKFFELTPVEFEVQESFTNYDTTAYQESSDDRRYLCPPLVFTDLS